MRSERIARQLAHNRKMTVVLLVVGLVNASLVAVVFGLMSRSWGTGFGVIFLAALCMLIALLIYEAMVMRGVQHRPPQPREEARLRPMVADLCQRMAIPVPRVLVADDEAANAFAIGRSPEKATIVFTTGLLSLLNDAELRAVAAHELAHIANRDTRVSIWSASVLGWALIVSFIGSFLAIVLGSIGVGLVTSGGRSLSEWAAKVCTGIVLIIAAIAGWVMLQLWVLMAKVADLAVSRQRELMADATAAEVTGDPRALASALSRLDGGPVLLTHGSRSAQSLCFAGAPLTGEWLRDLFSTHPAPEKRIDLLLSYEQHPNVHGPATSSPSRRQPNPAPFTPFTPVMAGAARIGVFANGTMSQVDVREGERITIGRDPSNTVVLTDPKASRHHLEVVFARGQWRVRDLGATNPALLVAPGMPPRSLAAAGGVATLPHAQLRVGGTVITLFPGQ